VDGAPLDGGPLSRTYASSLVPDVVTDDFRFLPNEEEIVLGVLEKRRWHRRFWIAVATLLPGAGSLGVLLYEVTGSRAIAAIPAMGWIVTIVYSQLRTNLLPCPRCGGPFQTIGAFQRPWNPRCWSCDLSLNPPPR
jgi:hypothetical protein